MLEKFFAGVALVVCLALLLRMGLRQHQQRRVDAAAQRVADGSRRWARRIWFWRAHRQHAAREAEEAIRRAQRQGKRDGNVVRPDAFKGPPKH